MKITPHTRAGIASTIGVVIGVLTLIMGYFHSGQLPSSTEVATVLSGAGVSLGSVGAYIAHHLGVIKAIPAPIRNEAETLVLNTLQPAPASQATAPPPAPPPTA